MSLNETRLKILLAQIEARLLSAQDMLSFKMAQAHYYLEEAIGHLAAITSGICDQAIGLRLAERALNRACQELS
jgi:hypothetical protein